MNQQTQSAELYQRGNFAVHIANDGSPSDGVETTDNLQTFAKCQTCETPRRYKFLLNASKLKSALNQLFAVKITLLEWP